MVWRSLGSKTLIIPGIWIAILGSRPVSYWFGGGGGDEANPINTLVFVGLIGSATYILSKGGFDWGVFIRQNRALCLIYAYLALSALWSDMPLISLKRLGKDFGCVLVALVFLTQADPAAAVRTVFVRVSYLLFPLSVVFIKFFPDIGRQASRAGENMFTGITLQKNSLGLIVFIFVLILLWDFIEIYREEGRKGKKAQLLIRIGMFFMGFWLLKTCDSQTSLLCLILGVVILWGSMCLTRMRQGKRILMVCLVVMICMLALDKTFGLSDAIIRALGRNPNLTGRTDIWRIVLDQQTDPIIGTGFYTFWGSDKGKAVMNSFMKINEAHNGYLEMYVDGGVIGDVLLGLLLLAAGNRVINGLFTGAPLGKIGLVFWFLPIIYNWSETSFFRLDLLWFTFLLVTVGYQRRMPPIMVSKSA
jgi:exopolysaccharide production protein ExoQ